MICNHNTSNLSSPNQDGPHLVRHSQITLAPQAQALSLCCDLLSVVIGTKHKQGDMDRKSTKLSKQIN